jgi:ribosomal protein L37AE/L43A
MARPKSIVSTARVEEAKKAHDCRFDKSHRLERGMLRLTVEEEGKELHYCAVCGRQIVKRDIERLSLLLGQLGG